MNIQFGNFPSNMLDEDYLGFGEFFPDESPELALLTSTEIRVQDRFTNATVSLFGVFQIQGGLIAGGTVTRMTWKTGSGELLMDMSGFSLPIEQAIYGDLEFLFLGDDTITGGNADDILLGNEGNDLVSGGSGNDLLIAALGNDTLAGGPGSDILIGLDDPFWEIARFQIADTLLSSDGLYAVFKADADQFGYSAEPGLQAFFRLSLATGELTRVIGPFDPADIFEVPGGGGPVLSGDGSTLAFVGPASFANEPASGYPQLLIADLESGDISVASETPEGELAGYLPEALAISGDGSSVAFVYLDSDLVPNDLNGMRDIFLWQAGSGEISLASVLEDGTQADRPSGFPSLSADGQLLAFASAANNLTPESDGNWAAYVKNLDTGEVQYIASLTNPSEFVFDTGPQPLAISANGRYLAFVSYESELVDFDTNGVADVFVRDLVTGETVRASEDFDGTEGQYFSNQPAISGDGRYVAFLTASTWFGELYDSNFRPDVFVKDLATGMLSRIPVPDADFVGSVPGNAPQLTFDGQMLIYRYGSTDTVLGLLQDNHVHIMQGGPGDDILVAMSDEIVQENWNDGYDIFVTLFADSYSLPENVDALAHAGSNDFIGTGNSLDNRFIGQDGNDTWFGGNGVDTLSYAALHEEVLITRNGNTWSLEHEAAGLDSITGVERVEFDDIALALPFDSSARSAFGLLYVALAETPDPETLATWMVDFDQGLTTEQVAQHVLDYYAPSGIPHEALMSILWLNLIGEPISQPDLDYFVGELQSGNFTQAGLFAAAAEHPLNQQQIEPLIALGMSYHPDPFDWNMDAWEEFI